MRKPVDPATAQVQFPNGSSGKIEVKFIGVGFSQQVKDECLIAIQDVIERHHLSLRRVETKQEGEKRKLLELLKNTAASICFAGYAHTGNKLTQVAIFEKWTDEERKLVGVSSEFKLSEKLKKHGIKWEIFKEAYDQPTGFELVTLKLDDGTEVTGSMEMIDWEAYWRNAIRRARRKTTLPKKTNQKS